MEEQVSIEVKRWLDRISDYEREFDTWEGRSDKILKRYTYEDRGKNESEARYNILWANVQTLTAATFAKVPKPDVSRRFKDQDPVGRVAGMILERALDYEVQKYSSYASTLKACVHDRFLGGRGTAWVRYEPHFRAAQSGQPQDGLGVTEDVDSPQEQLDYECAPCDYVHWRDFGHVLARTWEEVPAVWRKVYLTRDKCIERFGEEVGNEIPLDARPEDFRKKQQGNESNDDSSRALVYEIWDKTTKTAIWLSKSLNKIVDQKSDPLGLEDFWPCPKPLYATLTNDSLIPIPDFTLYQDQANTLDILSDRIDGLIKAMKVFGVYDSSAGDLQRLFTESSNNTLIPVKDWTTFSEKSGLKGSMDIVDLTPIANALQQSYAAMEQVKQQVYDITGISDIVRGQTNAAETATAQQIKGQYASLRLRQFQDEVSQFATEIIRIQAQIICKQFSPQTIVSISAADQLIEQDQAIVQKALKMLTQKGPNPVRSFRIDIAADSLIQLDEQQEKQDRLEFLSSVTQFISGVAPIVQGQPAMLPVVGELLKFGVRSFKVGKSVEGAIDSAIDSVGKQPPSPSQEELQQLEQKKQEIDQGTEQLKQEQDKVKEGIHGLEKKGLEIDKKGLELEKKALELGYRESSFGLQQDASKQVDGVKKEHESSLLQRDKQTAEALKQLTEAVTQIVKAIPQNGAVRQG